MEVINALGRRKTAVARVYMSKGSGKIVVNKKEMKVMFPIDVLQGKINQPFILTDTVGQFDIKVNVMGGGINGQAEAIRMAVARALCKIDIEHRPALKAKGLLTRDPRMVERKKFGQRKARRRFQFSKR